MKRTQNILLLLTFIAAMLEPVTGIVIHKLSAASFLLMSMIHIIIYRKEMKVKRWILFALILICFFSGLFGMIFDYFPAILVIHQVGAVVLVFFLAIHIFVFHKKICRKRRVSKKGL